MRWYLAAFLPLLVGAINHYEIEGVFSGIKPEDVKHSLNHRAGFLSSEQKIRKALDSLSPSFLTDFYIDFFEIHGEAHDHSTTIFHGFLSTALTRLEIENLIKDHESLHIFLLLAKDKIPTAPSLIAAPSNFDLSCSNGGVLLPNSTCACKPFYAGPSCEEVQCLHNGIQTGGRCTCPPGVSTLHCEPRSCIPGLVDDFNRDKSTFILVINQDISVAQFLNDLFGQLNNLNYDSYNTFLVVNYLVSSKGFYMQYKQFTYWTDMLDYLNGIVSIASGVPVQPTNAAIALAQSFSPDMLPFSRILVATASIDSEDQLISNDISSDLVSTTAFLRALSWRNRIIYLIPDVNVARIKFYTVFNQIAQATLGSRIFFDVTKGDFQNLLSSVLSDLAQTEPIAFVNGQGDMEVDVTSNDNITVLLTTKPGSKNLPTVSIDDGNVTVLGQGTFGQILSVPPVNKIKLTGGDDWTLMAFNQGTKTAIVSYSDDFTIDVGSAYASIGGAQAATGVLIGASENITLEWIDPATGKPLFESVNGFQRSDECSFPATFASFDALTTPGIYYQRITFRESGDVRLIPGFVGDLVPQHVPSRTCFNGGTKKPDGTCDCVSGFTGGDCTNVECLNFGTPNQFPGGNLDYCLCPPGYHGDHCEKKQCYSDGNDFFNNPNKSLVLVVQNSMSQAIVNGYLTAGLSDLLINDRKHYDEFVITTFNNVAKGGQNITKINTNSYTSYEDFLTALTNISYLASYTPTQDSTSALKTAIQSVTNYNSPVYLLVDSAATTTNNDNEVVKSAMEKLATINVIQTSPFNSQANCMTSDSSLFYQHLAINTGGVYLNLCANVNEIPTYFHSYGPYFYGSQLVSEERPTKCVFGFNFELSLQEKEEAVFVINGDSSSKFAVKLIANSDAGTAQTLNPAPNGIPSLGIYPIPVGYIDNKNKYTISVESQEPDSSDFCSAKVFTKSNFNAFFGLNTLGVTNATSSLSYGTPFQVTMFSNTNLDGLDGFVTLLFPTKTTTDNQFAPSECQQQILFPNNFVCDGSNDLIIMKGQVQLSQTSAITRSQRTICYQPRSTCLNGGIWENNICKCNDLFNGTLCEIPICLNGFSVTEERTCQCYHSSAPAQYSGVHCEHEVCPSLNFMEAADSREFDFRQIIFVVNTNVDMLLVDVYLKSMMEQFSNEVQDPVNPKQFTLVTFDETNVISVISTSNVAKFVSALNSALSMFSKVSGQNTRSLDALHEALRLVVEPTATIFLLTGSSSTDPVATGGILPSQRIGTQINVIYTPQGTNLPRLPLDDRLTLAARISGGRVLPLTQNSLPQFYNFAKESIKENALIFDHGVEKCMTPQHFAFWVENSVTRLIFDVTGDAVSDFLVVDDQKGQRVNYTRKFSDTGAVIAEIVETSRGSLAGQWSFGVSANSGSCLLQVRAESAMRVIPGFTTDIFNDFPTAEPFGQRGNPSRTRVVARITGAPGNFMKGVEVDGLDPVHPWNSTQIGYADAHGRDSSACAFQYASESFDVTTDYRYQRFRITGKDSDGNYFRRLFFFDLSNPDSTCVNGAINATSGLCVCDTNHYGDDCSERRCVNGGTSSFGICACTTNYYGLYCENYVPSTATTEATLPTTTTTVTSAPQTTPEAPLPSTNNGEISTTTIQTESTTVFATQISSAVTTTPGSVPTTVIPSETTIGSTNTSPIQSTNGPSTVTNEPTGINSFSTAVFTTEAQTTTTVATSQGLTATSVATPQSVTATTVVDAATTESATSESGSSVTPSTLGSATSEVTYTTIGLQTSTQGSLESTPLSTTQASVAPVDTTIGAQSTVTSVTSVVTSTPESGTTTPSASNPPPTESDTASTSPQQSTTSVDDQTTTTNSASTNSAEGQSTASVQTVATTEIIVTGSTTVPATVVSSTLGSQTPVNAQSTVQVTSQTEITNPTASQPQTTTVSVGTTEGLQSTVNSEITVPTTSQAQTTVESVETTQGSQSTLNIETTAAVETTTTMATTTTTPGPCDPASTTYFYSFFVDSADFFPPSNVYQQEHAIVSAVATNVSLGSGLSNTRFAISGVMSTFYPGGIANTTDDVDDFFTDGSLYGDMDNILNFSAGIDGYFGSGYSDILPTEVPGIAVLFAHLQPDGTVDDFSNSVKKLRDANYKVIGIDLNLGLPGGPSDYFTAVLGQSNVFVPTTTKDGADFITGKGCQFKPL